MEDFSINFVETGSNIVLIEMSGSINSTESFKKFKDFSNKLDSRIEAKFKDIEGKANFLINVKGLSLSTEHSLDVFKVLEQSTKRTKKYDGKTAIYGANYSIELLAEAIMALSSHDDIQFFKTKEDAVKWLEE